MIDGNSRDQQGVCQNTGIWNYNTGMLKVNLVPGCIGQRKKSKGNYFQIFQNLTGKVTSCFGKFLQSVVGLRTLFSQNRFFGRNTVPPSNSFV